MPKRLKDLVKIPLNEEKMIERFCKGRVEDQLHFEYPECPEIDIEKRYTNQEYIKELKEKFKK